MDKGLSLAEFSGKVQKQNESKRDFFTPTEKIHIIPMDDVSKGDMGLTFKNGRKEEAFLMNRVCLGQIAEHTKVPMKLVDLCQSGSLREKQALCELLSVRLQENPVERMVRTMDMGQELATARAFLSKTYRRLDNFDLFGGIYGTLKEIADTSQLRVESCELTDTRMYIKVIVPTMQYKIGTYFDKNHHKVGDIVQAGASISNSEVGWGAIKIEPLIYRIACLNGMISQANSMRRNHIGRNNFAEFEETTGAQELYSKETLALDDAAIFGKVSDTVRAVLTDSEVFRTIALKMMSAQNDKIGGDIPAVVEELGRKFTFNQDETTSILNEISKSGDLSKFGLANAVTAFARNDKRKLSYDRVTDLERTGGQIIELGESEWRVISDAVTSGDSKPKRGRKK